MTSLVAILDPLVAAKEAFAAGTLGERELIAIALAVNAELRALPLAEQPRASFALFSNDADAALHARVAELDRGEA